MFDYGLYQQYFTCTSLIQFICLQTLYFTVWQQSIVENSKCTCDNWAQVSPATSQYDTYCDTFMPYMYHGSAVTYLIY